MARITTTLTISIHPDMARVLDKLCKKEHRTRSELMREELRRYLTQSGTKCPHDLTKIHEVL